MLSGGEQQRLALARAWALKPEVLFLDEPTASLDPAATRAVEALVAVLRADGTKIVMTTHDLGQARRLADEVLFLHQGRLVEQAPAANSSPRRVARRRAPSSQANCYGDTNTQRSRPYALARYFLAGAVCLPRRGPGRRQEKFITVASTTSTEQSGLFKHLLPLFKAKTGIEVRVVALGTGQALEWGAGATPTSSSCTTRGRGEVRRRGLRASSASR